MEPGGTGETLGRHEKKETETHDKAAHSVWRRQKHIPVVGLIDAVVYSV